MKARSKQTVLSERQKKIEALRAALIEGEQSGPARPFDVEAFLKRMHRERARKNKRKTK